MLTASPTDSFDRAQVSQISLGGFQVWKQLLFFFKGSRMHATPAAAQLHRVPQMEHLVIDQIFQRVLRNRRTIKDAAYHDGVVAGIVVTQATAGGASPPPRP